MLNNWHRVETFLGMLASNYENHMGRRDIESYSGSALIRVYIACPYGDHNPLAVREVHVAAGDAAARELALRGHTPVCTVRLTHRWNEDERLKPAHWWRIDLDLLTSWADAVCRLPGESEGADAEVAIAQERGMPVYFGVEAVPEAQPGTVGSVVTLARKGAPAE